MTPAVWNVPKRSELRLNGSYNMPQSALPLKDAQLMWGSVLQATKSAEITFVTTNYDRAIELAANGEGICPDDGFGLFAEGETVPWTGFNQDRQHPLLVKLHGSTDWYADSKTGSPTKLRHPMPLFGRSVLRLSEGKELSSALVLPSREKLLSKGTLSAPFADLSQCSRLLRPSLVRWVVIA